MGKVARNTRPLLSRMRHLLQSKSIIEPRWYQAALQVPPDGPLPKLSSPPRIENPETGLIKGYLKRNPESKMFPLSLHKDTHFIRTFAQRQLQHMQAGYSKSEAYKLAERELQGEYKKAQNELFPYDNLIKTIQEEEEVHIANLLILKAQKDQEAADEAVAAIQSQKEYLDELDEQEKLGIVDEPVDVSH
mmetsp:Transcript_8771/g.16548  ORF Transcript_8771/g.16548 Transcript_8771/m.16548 type:complete len:190 (+) Transcript_8771:141-710(+)